MLRSFHALTPSFLKKFDQYLLLNYPHIWTTRIHHVAFWGSLYFLLLNVISWTYPMAPNNVPDTIGHFLILGIPSAIFFLFWVYQLSLFKVEANFGISNVENRFLNQFIYAGIIFFLGTLPYYHSTVLHYRIGFLVSEKTIIQDYKNIRALPGDWYALSFDLPYLWEDDGIAKIQTIKQLSREIEDVPINSSIYDENGVLTTQSQQNVEKGIKAFNRYSPNQLNTSTNYFEQRGEGDDDYIQDDKVREIHTKAEANFDRIIYAQYSSNFSHSPESPAILIWFLLGISILLFIFLKVEPKTFLIASVSGFSLVMAMVLATEMVHSITQSDRDNILFFVYISILAGMAALAFSTRNTQRFQLVRKVALILLAAGISFVPILGHKILFDYHSAKIEILIGSLFVTWAMWNMIFAGKMRTLSVNPSQN